MGKSKLFDGRFLLLLLMIFQLISGPAIPPVSAVNDQGLHWSIETGSLFNYTFKCTTLITTSIPIGDYEIYFNITSLPIIEDNITSVDDFRLECPYNYDMYFQNGTKHNFGLYSFIILPTENWSLMQNLWNNSQYYANTMTWINTTTEWGFIGESGGVVDELVKWWYVFSKADGHLLLYFVGSYNDDIQDDYVELRCDSYSSYSNLIEPNTTTNPTSPTTSITSIHTGIDVNLILLVTGSAAIILILIVVYFKKLRA